MTDLEKAARQALEALERCVATCFDRYSHEEVMSRPEHFVNQTITALHHALEQPAIKQGWDVDTLLDKPKQPAQQEPVALKKGECWPEDVMQMWDYYRKEIANGNTGSEPRDWFESLAEMRLVDTRPQAREPLTDVVKAAQGVLEWTEIAHRPPVRDKLEAGRMVGVRLHALADLHDALAAHGIKGNA